MASGYAYHSVVSERAKGKEGYIYAMTPELMFYFIFVFFFGLILGYLFRLISPDRRFVAYSSHDDWYENGNAALKVNEDLSRKLNSLKEELTTKAEVQIDIIYRE